MKIPLFPLDLVLFPGAALPLHIFEERYKQMVGECLQQKGAFGVVRARRDGLAVIGCTADITTVLNRYDDGRLDILCKGCERFEIELLDDSRDFLQAEVDFIADDGPKSTREQREQCAAMHFEMLHLSGSDGQDFPRLDLDTSISLTLASTIPSDPDFKQDLLSMRSDAQRSQRLLEFYEAVLPKLRLGAMAQKISSRNGHVM
ncbi:MAG: LON peptidase substrate-binding domain-containing protein [Acidobacteriaceae bacterium]